MPEVKKRGRPRKDIQDAVKVPEVDKFKLVDIVEPTINEPDLLPLDKEEDEESSLISKELIKFEKQVAEIQDALESINLKSIEDIEERLKAINSKIAAQLKLPQLLSALEDLKNKHQVRADAIKGNKSFSPLEDGTLDDDED